MEKILNLKQINEIFEGDAAAIQEILGLLDESIPEFIEKINFCMEEDNFELLKFAIHKFKSSCQLVTNGSFIELIRNIEKGKHESTTAVKPEVDNLIQLTYTLQKEIQELTLAA